MSARDDILSKLRTTLNRADLRFPPQHTPPLTAATRVTVTQAQGDGPELAHRFGQELTTLHGSYEFVETATEARLALINRLLAWQAEEKAQRKGPKFETGQDQMVLSWSVDALPVGGIRESLADLEFTLIAPAQLDSSAARDDVRFIRYGLTGVEAACASTGSLIVTSGAATSRAASLLPLRHIALVPMSRLFPTLEDWVQSVRDEERIDQLFGAGANVSMITGPSKSADIGGALTLGVHGPKFVHAIVFQD